MCETRGVEVSEGSAASEGVELNQFPGFCSETTDSLSASFDLQPLAFDVYQPLFCVSRDSRDSNESVLTRLPSQSSKMLISSTPLMTFLYIQRILFFNKTNNYYLVEPVCDTCFIQAVISNIDDQ